MSQHSPSDYERFDLPPRPPDAVSGNAWLAAAGPLRPVSFAEAVALAEETMNRDAPEMMAVLCAAEAEFGWVFALQGVRYIQTRNFSDQLVGHGVTIVDRATGSVYCSGSATPLWGAVLRFLELREAQRAG